jgi:hypothetical protein
MRDGAERRTKDGERLWAPNPRKIQACKIVDVSLVMGTDFQATLGRLSMILRLENLRGEKRRVR